MRMIVKTSELTGIALDWAVATCEGEEVRMVKGQLETLWTENGWKPSTDWAQAGPIIEREGIDLMHIRNADLSVSWVATWDSGETEFNGGDRATVDVADRGRRVCR